MIFIVRKASDQTFEEKREIFSIAALVGLAGGLKYDLIVSPPLLRGHPEILICDKLME